MQYVELICSVLFGMCTSIPSITESVIQSEKLIPVRCKPYVGHFANSSNISRELAQTEQESGCNPLAESAYAKGLRQFTDKTGEWLSTTHCKHLGDFDPFNASWSIQCGLIYMNLLERNNDYGEYCVNRKVAEMEYNGGSWVIWELEHVDRTSLSDAKEVCGTKLDNGRKRAKWACKENYDYPHLISEKQTKYLSLGGKQCSI